MSLYTQDASVNRRNPFEQYPKNIAPRSSQRAKSYAAPNSRPSATPQPNANPFGHNAQPLRVVPRDAQERVLRRQKILKKRQLALLVGVRRVLKLLGVLALIFVLLPSAMQQKVYRGLPFSMPQHTVAAVSLPPLPVDYDYISSPFGRRWGRQHQGIDFAASVGEPIYAALPGMVVHSGWEAGYGKSVVIDHGNGLQTRYGHCSRLLAKEGDVVRKGGEIALVGSTGHSTGPHLHFEVIVDGVRKNPAKYFSFSSNEDTSHLASADNGDDE